MSHIEEEEIKIGDSLVDPVIHLDNLPIIENEHSVNVDISAEIPPSTKTIYTSLGFEGSISESDSGDENGINNFCFIYLFLYILDFLFTGI